MNRYPVESVWQEIVYLAYHLHWDLDDLLDLEHEDRVRLVAGVSALNARAWQTVQQSVQHAAQPQQPAARSGGMPPGLL